jgi:hypothetical protein
VLNPAPDPAPPANVPPAAPAATPAQPAPPAPAANQCASYDGDFVPQLFQPVCSSCHTGNSRLPQLSPYAQADRLCTTIGREVASGSMPPNGRLSAAQKAIVASWVAGGCPETAADAALACTPAAANPPAGNNPPPAANPPPAGGDDNADDDDDDDDDDRRDRGGDDDDGDDDGDDD